MLPVAKALVITVLLGGGAVGTCALAGGFGPGGNSSGNGEATAQVAATEATRPAVTEKGAKTAPTEGNTRADDGNGDAEGSGQQREAGISGDSQGPQSVPQINDQNDPQPPGADGASGKQGPIEGVGVDDSANSPGNITHEGEAVSSSTGTQGSKGSDSEENGLSEGQVETEKGKGGDERGTDPSAVPNPKSTGDGVEETISGDEETRTASGGEDQQDTGPETGTN